MLYYLSSTLSTAIGPLCDRECDRAAPSRPLSRIHALVGVLNRLSQFNCAIVVQKCLNPFNTSAKQKRNRGRNFQQRPGRRLNSQPQGVTKSVPALDMKMLLRYVPSPLTLTYVLLTYVLEILDSQARKGNNKRKRISSGGVRVFHVKGLGPNSSVCPSIPKKQTFWRGVSGFWLGYPGGARKI